MILMLICAALVVCGVAAIVAWGGDEIRPLTPEAETDSSKVWAARRYTWHVLLGVVGGVGAGLLIAGAGGRLAMRLLAVTAGEAAQGRVTEANEIVGQISLQGTLNLIAFVTLFFGPASGLLYMLIRRWLPRGRWSGVAYGVLLLLVASTRIEPLRVDNPDFDIVGPGWAAASVYTALVVMHGMLVAALAARYSRIAPPIARGRPLVAYLPLLMLAPIAPLIPIVLAGGAVAVAGSRTRFEQAGTFLESTRTKRGIQLVLAGVALAALPGFAVDIADIVARQP